LLPHSNLESLIPRNKYSLDTKTRQKMRIIIVLLTLVALTIIVGSTTAENRKRSDDRTQSRKAEKATITENSTGKGTRVVQQPTTIVNDSVEVTKLAPLPVDITSGMSSPATGEQIKWQVIASGGGKGTSTNFALTGTVGQTAVGSGQSTNFKLSQGFWQNFATGCCLKEGDCNHNNAVNVGDVSYLIRFLFQGGPAPNCAQEADVNDTNSINVSDVTALVRFLFGNPSIPFPGGGVCP
jgi:Dockerin type I domain